MALDKLQTAIADFLGPRLDPPMLSIGGGLPRLAEEVPAIAMSMDNVTVSGAGVGANATSVMVGALPITSTIDLADPVLRFPSETVDLMSGDRLSLHVPHGPLVKADGADSAPLEAADITIGIDGAPLTFVPGSPSAGEFSIDKDAGLIAVGDPFPAVGALNATYFVGRWEVETVRLSGVLHMDLFIRTIASVEDLTQQVFALLAKHSITGLRKIGVTAMSTIDAPVRPTGNTRTRRISFEFTYEHATPRIPTGGGVISGVDFTSQLQSGQGVENELIN
ncbi:MAG: hypothetical protein JSW26_00095 [Desulfobacterales bacterium]|nr:MAG: hypothetical protein JSW26_00095 [Desulfobacterales bacterium]